MSKEIPYHGTRVWAIQEWSRGHSGWCNIRYLPTMASAIEALEFQLLELPWFRGWYRIRFVESANKTEETSNAKQEEKEDTQDSSKEVHIIP